MISDEELIITVSDARAYFKGCIPGWQSFAETHGFSWPEVVRHGLTAKQLLDTKDAMAINLVKFVRERHGS